MKMMTAAAAIAAVLVSAATAYAQPAQQGSNRNLSFVSAHIESAIDQLQNDSHDYGGHRAEAIYNLEGARNDIADALAYWHRHGAPVAQEEAIPHALATFPPASVQAASNENLRSVSIHVESAIDALQGDATDYGDYKAKAIQALDSARTNLKLALQYWQQTTHGSAGPASDSNLRFVEANVLAAINRLQQDAHDYGGHRVAAITDMKQGDAAIATALSYDRSHEGSGTMGTQGRSIPGLPNVTQAQSNDSLADTRHYLEAAIDALTRDNHDYNGNRVRAIGSLQAARSQLLAALQYRSTH